MYVVIQVDDNPVLEMSVKLSGLSSNVDLHTLQVYKLGDINGGCFEAGEPFVSESYVHL